MLQSQMEVGLIVTKNKRRIR